MPSYMNQSCSTYMFSFSFFLRGYLIFFVLFCFSLLNFFYTKMIITPYEITPIERRLCVDTYYRL